MFCCEMRGRWCCGSAKWSIVSLVSWVVLFALCVCVLISGWFVGDWVDLFLCVVCVVAFCTWTWLRWCQCGWRWWCRCVCFFVCVYGEGGECACRRDEGCVYFCVCVCFGLSTPRQKEHEIRVYLHVLDLWCCSSMYVCVCVCMRADSHTSVLERVGLCVCIYHYVQTEMCTCAHACGCANLICFINNRHVRC